MQSLTVDVPSEAFINIYYRCENCGKGQYMSKLVKATITEKRKCWSCNSDQPKYFDLLLSVKSRIDYHFASTKGHIQA